MDYFTSANTNPIPRTEKSLELKLARKVTKRSKKDLRGSVGYPRFWKRSNPPQQQQS